MASLFDQRRYLTDFDSSRMGHIVADVLVVGSGVAGARAALAAAAHGSVVLLCKSSFTESNTNYAQGGIAVAIEDGDTPQEHYDDTMRVGSGLSRAAAVRRLVEDGPQRVRELIGWGMALDHCGEALELGREGGHGTSRVVHSDGDQTGRELVRVLAQRVRENDRIRVFEGCFLLDLLGFGEACAGAAAYHKRFGHQLVWAKQTILATGGCGRIWRETTNPPVATGDGMAAAFRAGARLCDMEMVQFHPTTLYVAGAGRALISEAVRGEGARLVDARGERFMEAYHPDRELAPRDIVSRAIRDHVSKTRSNCVYLDVRHLTGFAARFPHIDRLCRSFEVNPETDLIPVRPSAHYMIGGVDVDLEGRSSLPGLWVCGEASCSGVHGANRLASNSLLEGLVFGAIAGAAAGQLARTRKDGTQVHDASNVNAVSSRTELDLSDIQNSLRSVMWRNVGVVRRGSRLRETCEILDFWGHYVMDKTFDHVAGWELQNQLTVARLIARSALARDDSVGVHFRAEHEPSEPVAPYHLTVVRDAGGTEVARRSQQDAEQRPSQS